MINRNATVQEQHLNVVRLETNRYNSILKPDLSEEDYMLFYSQIIDCKNNREIIDKVLYCYTGENKFCGSDTDRKKLDYVR